MVSVELHFFDLNSFRRTGHLWRHRLMELFVGRGQPVHVLAKSQGWWWICEGRYGCIKLPAGRDLPFPTCDRWRIEIDELDDTLWLQQHRTTPVATFFDALHLLPRGYRVINCVTAIAELLCIEQQMRTPRDLIDHLEKLCTSSLQPDLKRR